MRGPEGDRGGRRRLRPLPPRGGGRRRAAAARSRGRPAARHPAGRRGCGARTVEQRGLVARRLGATCVLVPELLAARAEGSLTAADRCGSRGTWSAARPAARPRSASRPASAPTRTRPTSRRPRRRRGVARRIARGGAQRGPGGRGGGRTSSRRATARARRRSRSTRRPTSPRCPGTPPMSPRHRRQLARVVMDRHPDRRAGRDLRGGLRHRARQRGPGLQLRDGSDPDQARSRPRPTSRRSIRVHARPVTTPLPGPPARRAPPTRPRRRDPRRPSPRRRPPPRPRR